MYQVSYTHHKVPTQLCTSSSLASESVTWFSSWWAVQRMPWSSTKSATPPQGPQTIVFVIQFGVRISASWLSMRWAVQRIPWSNTKSATPSQGPYTTVSVIKFGIRIGSLDLACKSSTKSALLKNQVSYTPLKDPTQLCLPSNLASESVTWLSSWWAVQRMPRSSTKSATPTTRTLHNCVCHQIWRPNQCQLHPQSATFAVSHTHLKGLI